jgi:DNA-binding CsgD family transcriptional regulator
MNTAERVAELLDKGMTVLEVARLLNISPQAVYGHITRHGLRTPSERAS